MLSKINFGKRSNRRPERGRGGVEWTSMRKLKVMLGIPPSLRRKLRRGRRLTLGMTTLEPVHLIHLRIVILSREDGEGSLFARERAIRLRGPSSSTRFAMTRQRSAQPATLTG